MTALAAEHDLELSERIAMPATLIAAVGEALAGGAILYVIGEIWAGVRRYNHRELGLYLLAGGFLLGIATDLVVSYGGG